MTVKRQDVRQQQPTVVDEHPLKLRTFDLQGGQEAEKYGETHNKNTKRIEKHGLPLVIQSDLWGWLSELFKGLSDLQIRS